MQSQEVRTLLITVNGLDSRVPVTTERISAWSTMLSEKAATMTLAEAQQIVRDHYADTATVITLDIFIAAHRRKRTVSDSLNRSEGEAQDAHCFRSGCNCSHAACFRGWVDSDSSTSPCRQCRPALALVLDEIAPLGSRNPHDQQLLESIEHRRELLGWSGISR